MRLTFASYNIHKGVGLDRRRDPERIIAILREIDADVIALQEADRRFGSRAAVIPQAMLDHSPWRPVGPRGFEGGLRPQSMGWHGNVLLVRRDIVVEAAGAVPLPTLEPRGAVWADLRIGDRAMRVVGMHLDLSGLRRRHQICAVCDHAAVASPTGPMRTVLMGDMNEWSATGGAFRALGPGWQLLAPGRTFPARRPVARLDRIVASADWQVEAQGVHHSPLAAVGSDHLPVWARMAAT